MSPRWSPGSVPLRHGVSQGIRRLQKRLQQMLQPPASADIPAHLSSPSCCGEDPVPGWEVAHGASSPPPCARPAGLSRDKRRLRTSTGFYSSDLTSNSTNSLWKKEKNNKNKRNPKPTFKTRGRLAFLRAEAVPSGSAARRVSLAEMWFKKNTQPTEEEKTQGYRIPHQL